VSGCCSTYGDVAGAHFDEKIARRELSSYRKNGPGSTTRLIRDLLLETGRIEGVLLDVGAGIGGLTFELLGHGVGRAIAVDASAANLAAATEEATRRGQMGAVQFVQGDFLDVAPEIPHATVVTLDRVICCYPLYASLLEESLRHAERYFAFSYPRDLWYVRLAIAFENAVRRIRGNPFRAFVHPVDRMRHVIEGAGFRLVSRRQTLQWSADVYVRSVTRLLDARGTLLSDRLR
jgi:SAM-dependent methyltransferase